MLPDPTPSVGLMRMVRDQIEARGIHSARVLDAMLRVDRAAFVPEDLQTQAYSDGPLPIGGGQTISQPYMVALMTTELDVGEGDRVLEIGTGSGYQTAILARLASEVFTVEYDPTLAERARATLDALGIANVHYQTGDGTLGMAEAGPFDRILAAAAAPNVPPPLLAQLATPGVLLMPIGHTGSQRLVKVRRAEEGDRREEFCPCSFVLMRGKYGFGK